MKSLLLLLLCFTGTSALLYSQQQSLVIGDTVNATVHTIFSPFDTIRQKEIGLPDTCYLDLNYDGYYDLLFLCKGNLQYGMGAGENYFTVTPLNGNEIMIERFDTSSCIRDSIRPLICCLKAGVTIDTGNLSCSQTTFIKYSLWVMGAPCSVNLGAYHEIYMGVRIHAPSMPGMAWLKIQTTYIQDAVGLTGIIKEFAFYAGKSPDTPIDPLEINLFPNPTREHFTITGVPYSFMDELRIFAQTGQLLHRETPTSNQISVDLASGLYIVVVQLKNGQTISSRLLIL